ncbi:hypothetical protein HanXRQr2_Chr16g0776921 [Helianthus annuus]|uniref:Uncharacterized protein n=1 Tax=Helianthus annuus TaxID=4232 RepID=A0A9K3DY54_HELAN|nr:hypothetical protein HanXRQr2_Chr16g0776921 [Helianthus annuus]KAJ0823573.1 hypothetical protein HanPSC8_Chr16g0745291 [Helianthus annuus]
MTLRRLVAKSNWKSFTCAKHNDYWGCSKYGSYGPSTWAWPSI